MKKAGLIEGSLSGGSVPNGLESEKLEAKLESTFRI